MKTFPESEQFFGQLIRHRNPQLADLLTKAESNALFNETDIRNVRFEGITLGEIFEMEGYVSKRSEDISMMGELMLRLSELI